ncbi:MAG: hypothetical protein ACTSUE_23410 [Promethearchaeota archaeon]
MSCLHCLKNRCEALPCESGEKNRRTWNLGGWKRHLASNDQRESWWAAGGQLVGSWWAAGGQLVGSWWAAGGLLVAGCWLGKGSLITVNSHG